MNEFDELINSSSKSEKNNKPFDLEIWKEKKNKERNDAYDLIDKTILDLVKSEEKLKIYLDVQSRFDKLSVSNALLITAQMPNATQLKDYDDWVALNGNVNHKASSIKILEPAEYINSEGKTSINYRIKKVFDISQTSFKNKSNREKNYADNILWKALLHKSPVAIKSVDNLPNNSQKNVSWNKEDKTMYVAGGLDIPELFYKVSSEFARITFANQLESPINDYKCEYAAYMICNKLGIDVSAFKIEIPEELSLMNAQTIKAELTSVRVALEDTNNRINNFFEELSKISQKKNQERDSL